MTQRRRAIFWELYSIDSFKVRVTRSLFFKKNNHVVQGVGSGRPSVFHPDVVDCELPIDKEATLNEEGEEIPSCTSTCELIFKNPPNIISDWHWKHCFVRDVMTSVSGRFNSARPLKYSEILDLDQRVREFGSQWKIKQWRTSLADVDGIRGYVQRHMITCMKDIGKIWCCKVNAIFNETLTFLSHAQLSYSFIAISLQKQCLETMKIPCRASFRRLFSLPIGAPQCFCGQYERTFMLLNICCFAYGPFGHIV